MTTKSLLGKPLSEQKARHAHLAQTAREAGFATHVDDFGRGEIRASSTESVGRLLDQRLRLKPMASAPKPKENEYFKVLVLDEWWEGGELTQGWKMVYWLDAFDGRPAGWHEKHCGDLRSPLGWVLTTAELSLS
jgi:hypothetical protein